MKLCLASISTRPFLVDEFYKCPYILESYYSMEEWEIPIIKNCEWFVLDSGAFTFMNGVKDTSIDFDKYLTEYIDFINKHDIQHFFELDIDVVVGLEEVERLRRRLENETGKKCIPVWHKSRGKEYFLKMCVEYDYVAIGGIVTKEITPNEYKYFKWFIDTAHSHDCKIHGLGFTNLSGIYEYPFDSVDSSSWCNGGRFGTMYHFEGYKLTEVSNSRRRREDIGTNALNRHNYYEWLKLQEYADKYL